MRFDNDLSRVKEANKLEVEHTKVTHSKRPNLYNVVIELERLVDLI